MKGFYRQAGYLLIFSLLLQNTACKKAAYHDLESFHPRGQMIRFSCPDAKIGYAYAMQPRVTSPKYLVIYHERWGLDNHTKQEVERWFDYFGQQINVIAPDLYDGKKASTPDEAAALMKDLSEIRASHIVKGTYGLYGIKGRYAALGRGFGGYWALQAGILGLNQAVGSVVYYGNPIMDQAKITFLEADVLGIYAKKDPWVTPLMVENFQAFMQLNHRNLEVVQFNGKSGFASPGEPDYKKSLAQQADEAAAAFIKKQLDLP